MMTTMIIVVVLVDLILVGHLLDFYFSLSYSFPFGLTFCLQVQHLAFTNWLST
jgi:hypothetical protein